MPALTSAIRRPKLSEDVLSFSECRRTFADCIEKTRRTHRPILVTQNGNATSAIIGIADLEKLWDTLELMSDVQVAEEELDRGEWTSQEDFKAELLAERKTMRKELGL